MNRRPLLVELVSCGRCSLPSAAAPLPHAKPGLGSASASIKRSDSTASLAIGKLGAASANGTLAGPIAIFAVDDSIAVAV